MPSNYFSNQYIVSVVGTNYDTATQIHFPDQQQISDKGSVCNYTK